MSKSSVIFGLLFLSSCSLWPFIEEAAEEGLLDYLEKKEKAPIESTKYAFEQPKNRI